MALFREHADVSVRPAVAEDDAAVAGVQLAAWRSAHAETLGPDVLAALDPAAIRAQWAAAISTPPTPLHLVLVACDGPQVVGFAAIAPLPPDAGAQDTAAAEGGPTHEDAPAAPDGPPAGDEDTLEGGEILALEVRPDHQRGGHGSRLLTAAIDHFRSVDMTRAVTWVLDGDTAREQFLSGAGFGADGSWRELATGERTVREHRWIAQI